jgi:hypothetical protein
MRGGVAGGVTECEHVPAQPVRCVPPRFGGLLACRLAGRALYANPSTSSNVDTTRVTGH